jgi:hypothetical protein
MEQIVPSASERAPCQLFNEWLKQGIFCVPSSNPFPSVPGLFTAVAGSSIYRMTVLTTIVEKSRQWR